TGDGDQVLSGGGNEGDLPNLSIAKTGGSVTITDPVTVDGNLTVSGVDIDGTLILSGNSKTLDVASDVTLGNLRVSLGSYQELTLTRDVNVAGDLSITYPHDFQGGCFIVGGTVTGTSAPIEQTGDGVIVLAGSANDQLTGGDGGDTLRGGAGDDAIDGGAGTDTADYADASSAVTVNLGTGTATGGAGSDTLTNVENVTGSEYNDTITGDSQANVLDGQAGSDRLYGREGDDALLGGAGTDYLYGEEGNDTLAGGDDRDYLYGGSGDDAISGDAGDDYMRGDAGDDVIDGGAGTDYVDYLYSDSAVNVNLADGTATGEGNDTLISVEQARGSQYDDTLVGDDNANYLSGDSGDDTISGGAGNDSVYGGAGADVIDGGTGNDSVKGDAGDDTLSGGEGDDTLYGGTGDDVIDGGAGNDYASFYYSGSGVDVNLVDGTATGEGNDTLIDIERVIGSQHDDTITGDANNNTLKGYGGDDTISAGDGADSIYGGEGNDVVDAGAGNDYLYGEAGNDTLSGGAGDDYLRGDAGDDIIDGGEGYDQVSYYYSDTGVDVNLADGTATGQGNDTLSNVERVSGSQHDDTITGDEADNRLDGYGGDDVISGGGGADNMYGGDGDDLLVGGAGNDYLRGEAGSDTLRGGEGDDYFDGGSGADTVDYSDAAASVNVDLSTTSSQDTGGAGTDRIYNVENLTGSSYDDILTGSSGANVIDGGAGDDIIAAGGGNDSLIGGVGNDVMDAGSGDDTLSGGEGNDQLLGGAGNDVMDAGSGDDTLSGGEGNDQLIGGAGNDVMDAGSGDDRLAGGAGDDILDGGTGTDTADYSDAAAAVDANLQTGVADGEGHDTLSNIENLTGSSYDDTLTGNDGNNVIEGGAGSDTIAGGAGIDDLIGGSGDDIIDGGTGNDTLSGGEGSDQLAGGEGSDQLNGGTGNDSLSGGAGDDTLVGGTGDDTLDGGVGHDVADYSHATSGITVDLTETGPQDTGGAGTDTLVNIEEVSGSQHDDTFAFGSPTDGATYTVDGGDGSNTLDLTNFTMADATFDAVNGQITVELGEGESFTIDYSNVQTARFGDVVLDLNDLPPIAKAGVDQTVAEDAVVTLDGTSSYDPHGDSFTHQWVQVSGPSVTLSDPGSATPTFTAPNLVSNTDVTFELRVLEDGDSTTDTVTITINADNDAPTAEAGIDQVVTEGDTVTLSGSGTDPEGQGLTYEWTQTSGPNVTLSDANAANPTFTAPEGLANTDVTFELRVSDGTNTSLDTLAVTVNADNDAPTAEAGIDQVVTEGDTVTLSGSGTDPEGQGLTYEWTQTSGPSVTLSDANAANPTFTAPDTQGGSEVTFELRVSDGTNTSADTVTVLVGDTTPADELEPLDREAGDDPVPAEQPADEQPKPVDAGPADESTPAEPPADVPSVNDPPAVDTGPVDESTPAEPPTDVPSVDDPPAVDAGPADESTPAEPPANEPSVRVPSPVNTGSPSEPVAAEPAEPALPADRDATSQAGDHAGSEGRGGKRATWDGSERLEVLDPMASMNGAVELAAQSTPPPTTAPSTTIESSGAGAVPGFDQTRFIPEGRDFTLESHDAAVEPLMLPPELEQQSFAQVFAAEQGSTGRRDEAAHEQAQVGNLDALKHEDRSPENDTQTAEDKEDGGLWAALWGLLRGRAGTSQRADESASAAARQSERERRP
ncbi:MAG: hypothetical protein KKB50_13310, partial [Planctomycetes bacterium]|nr:hypothetical protein [Planctomycetota bacterium]